MSESRLSDGTDAVTSLTPRAHPVGTDPGFFALDRRRWRSLKDQYGGTLSRWYHDLARRDPRGKRRDHAPGSRSIGNRRDDPMDARHEPEQR
jgi:hypothetical protein